MFLVRGHRTSARGAQTRQHGLPRGEKIWYVRSKMASMSTIAAVAPLAFTIACGPALPPVEAQPAVVVAPVCPPEQPQCSTTSATLQGDADPDPGTPPTDMIDVPAGSFIRGCDDQDAHCDADERPSHRVTLDAFFIDRTEVTVSAYRACVEDAACSVPGTEPDCNFGVSDRSDHPVNCVNWSQASDFCHWSEKRLPTEAEWERAARGTDGRLYPWGSEPEASCSHAVMVGDGGDGCGTHRTWPVGSKPKGASPVGALDMAGNVWEWTADWYANYPGQAESVNPRGPETGSERVIKGGSWDDQYGAPILRAAARVGNTPDTAGRYLGFRCARGAP